MLLLHIIKMDYDPLNMHNVAETFLVQKDIERIFPMLFNKKPNLTYIRPRASCTLGPPLAGFYDI